MMNKRRSIFMAIALLAAAGFSSCNKDKNNNNNNNTPQQTCYITKVYNNNLISADYQYNGSNQITRADAYTSAGKLDFYYLTTYSSGKISKLDYFDESGMGKEEVTPTYNSDGTIKKIDRVTLGTGEKTTIAYEYNGSRQVTKATQTNDFGPVDYKTFTYDSKGNITKIETWVESGGPTPDLTETEELSYDDKNNATSSYMLLTNSTIYDVLLLDPTVSKNNITSYTSKDNNSVTDNDKSYTATYTYTSGNYPQTVKVNYLNGSSLDLRMDYNCK